MKKVNFFGTTMSPIVLIVNGVICIIIGVALGEYVQPMITGEWPTALSYGAYIWGVLSIYKGTTAS